MLNEDFERDYLKDAVYLQEEVRELEARIMEEINRNEAIIKVIKDESKSDFPKVSGTNPARVLVRYDLPFEDDRSGSRFELDGRRESKDRHDVSNAS